MTIHLDNFEPVYYLYGLKNHFISLQSPSDVLVCAPKEPPIPVNPPTKTELHSNRK